MGLQNRVTTIQRGAEDGLGLIQLAAHAHVLRALSGEQEGDLGRITAFDFALEHPGHVLTGKMGSEHLAGLGAIFGGERQAGGKFGAPGVGGIGYVRQGQRAAGKGRNPATGQEIKIPASKNARFKAGAALKAAVNKK